MKDVIVVLGGGINPDGSLPKFAEYRVDKGIELFKKKFSNKILMSAGISFQIDYVPPKTEAKAMKDYAISHGIPKDNILLEEKSKDTIGNAYFTKVDFLKPNNWKDIVVVTSEFHMERTKCIFQKVLGSEYQVDFIEVPSRFSKAEFENRIKTEKKILLFLKYWLSSINDGDDDKIKELLYKKHPGYAKNPEITKEEVTRLMRD